MLDYVPNAMFTGRKAYLQKLDTVLKGGQAKGCSIVVIYGTGGLGKTQLVLKFIFSHQVDFDSVFWFDCQSQSTLEASFFNIAQQLVNHYAQISIGAPKYSHIADYIGLAGLVNNQGQLVATLDATGCIIKSVQAWFRREDNKCWLLIFDNVDDIETFNVSNFFPKTSWGSIIITSRRPESARYGLSLPLEEMENEESIELLWRSTFEVFNKSKGRFHLVRANSAR